MCVDILRNSRTQGKRHMGDVLDHSKIQPARPPEALQHSTNSDQRLQKLVHMVQPPSSVLSAGDTWGKVNHMTCAWVDTWDTTADLDMLVRAVEEEQMARTSMFTGHKGE